MAHDRRVFLSRLGAAGAVMACPRTLFGASPTQADLIVINAKVYTIDPTTPRAQAFAVKGGRFLAVGTNADIAALAGPATKRIDAAGMTIVPGFIDCHVHVQGNILLFDAVVGNPYDVEFVTIDSIVAKLRARAEQTPADTWIDGYFYDDTKLKDGRPLDIRDLDKVSTTQPVAVHHRGGHTTIYNSKALSLAGITRDTQSMESGTYDKFPDGSLNGRVTDVARRPIDAVGKRKTYSASETMKRDRDGLAFMSKKFVEYGLTGVCHQGGNLQALEQVREAKQLLHRANFEANGKTLDAMIDGGITSAMGDEYLRFGATAEHTADGSLSERTMAMSMPYPGSNSPYQGNVTETAEELNAWVEKVHRAGIRPNIHANGDVAIDHALTAFERAQKALPTNDVRWKITHCSLVNPDIVKRMQALNVVPALFNSYLYYNSDKFVFYGPELLSRMMAYRTLLDAGIHVAGGSDFPPGVFAPLMGIQGMVTRTGWDHKSWGVNQRISVDEALRVMTLNGAYNTHEEDIKGSITTGKLADFVVLAEDPHTVDPNRIKDIRIVRTVVGGATVHEA